MNTFWATVFDKKVLCVDTEKSDPKNRYSLQYHHGTMSWTLYDAMGVYRTIQIYDEALATKIYDSLNEEKYEQVTGQYFVHEDQYYAKINEIFTPGGSLYEAVRRCYALSNL